MVESTYAEATQAFLTGQYEQGQLAMNRAVQLVREGKHPALTGHVLALGARWYGCQGEWDLAANMGIESRWSFEEQGLGAWAHWVATFTGLALVQSGQDQKGRSLLEANLTWLEHELPDLLVDGRCWLAQALLLLDERDTARGYLQELLIPTRPHGAEALYRQGVIALLLASLETDEEEWASVERAAGLASQWFSEIGHVPFWVSAQAFYGLQFVGGQRWAQAKDVFDVVVPLLQDTRYTVVNSSLITKAAAEVERQLKQLAAEERLAS